MEKRLKTRVQHKIDIEENWNNAINFIPLKGEIIIYDVDANNKNKRIKIGDGVKNVIDLDFLALPSTGEVIAPEGDIKPQVQVDWQQNNSSEVDYIKNRPFYENIDSFNTEFDSLISYEPIFSYWDEIAPSSNLYMDFQNVPELEEIEFRKVSDRVFSLEELLLSTFIYSPSIMDSSEYKAMGMRMEILEDITQDLINNLLVFTDENDECIILGPLAISKVGDKQYNTPTGGTIYFPEAGTYFGTSSTEGGLIGLKPKQTLKIDSDTMIMSIDSDTNMVAKMISNSYISKSDFSSMLQTVAFQQGSQCTYVNLKGSLKPLFIDSMFQETSFGWIAGSNNKPALACVSTPFEYAPGVTIPEGLWIVYYSDIDNNLLGGIVSFELRKEYKYIENKFIKQKDSISNLCITATASLEDGTMIAISPHISVHELELSLYGVQMNSMGIDNYLFSGLELKDMVIIDYYPTEEEITIPPSFSYNFILPTSMNFMSGDFSYDYEFCLIDLEGKIFDPSKAYTFYIARSLMNKYLYFGTFVEKGGASSADQASNADTVDGLHFRVAHEPPTEDEVDENTITFVI